MFARPSWNLSKNKKFLHGIVCDIEIGRCNGQEMPDCTWKLMYDHIFVVQVTVIVNQNLK